jgi:hypothetical protein
MPQLMAAWARNTALAGDRRGKLQQLRESRRSGSMNGCAKAHLHRLQIEAPGLLPLGEGAAQQCSYFAHDLSMDRLARFFPSALSVSFTGRTRQILSLTSTKEHSSCR